MWHLSFAALKHNFASNKVVKQADLFKEIGWDDLIGNDTYANTCAIRVSLALIKCGMNIPGRARIKVGPYRNKLIEMGQGNLSFMLADKSRLGAPEKFKGADYEKAIGNRSGVVSFWHLVPEARALADLSHPNIVTLFDKGVVEEKSYLVFEWLPGGDLTKFISEHGAMSWVEFYEQIGRCLLKALAPFLEVAQRLSTTADSAIVTNQKYEKCIGFTT